MRRAGFLTVLSLVAIAASARAQDTVRVMERGIEERDLARQAVRIYNASEVRLIGPTTVYRRDLFSGDVGALDGPLVVEGEIRGSLVVINADVELHAGARVNGDVIVVGGTLDQDPDAQVGGSVQTNGRRVMLRRSGSVVYLVDEPPVRRMERSPRVRRFHPGPRARASIAMGADGTYNRVEGLPYRAGIRIDWWGDQSGRLDAFAIPRTAGDFGSTNRMDLGYRVGGRMGFGNRAIEFGAWVYDVVAPVESWQMGDAEVGLASLFFHRDYRDYYLKRGLSGSVTLRPTPRFALMGEVSRDDEESVGARDPWTPFRDQEAWRANPAIDDGRYLHFTGRLEFDTRRSSDFGSGWFLRAEWERGRSDSVTFAPTPAGVRVLPAAGRYTYDRVFIDFRRYQAIGWSGDLRLRAVAAGTASLDIDGPLPLQRRLSLGGPGAMPGYPFREFSCNTPVAGVVSPALCDRMVLFQAEYRGDLTFGLFNFDRADSHPRDHRDRFRGILTGDEGDLWFDEPHFVLLANAGSAWLHPNRPDKLDMDLGGGIEFGSVGFYVARAVKTDAPFRYSLRLYHRF